MPTLMLRLAGPLQAWGTQSLFTMRDTEREPSKSGVIGLLCAALGRPRTADLSDLTALRMGVRADREGVLQRDYHTAINVYRANGKPGGAVVSNRYYLADGYFIAGLEGPQPLLETLHQALRNPHWFLFLGRKAFVPGQPVWLPDALQNAPLSEALTQYPWLAGQATRKASPTRLRLVLEDPTGPQTRRDVPISFATRTFGLRRVRTTYVAPVLPPQEETP